MDQVIKYFRATAAELKQVSWPTQKQAIFYTILVIAISVLVGLITGLFDFIFVEGIKLIVTGQV